MFDNNTYIIHEKDALKERELKQQKIDYLVELILNKPDITIDMVRPDLQKYFSEAYREAKKKIINEDNIKTR